MSWGRIEWSMSTIVASGSTVRIAPFIAPMYSPAPKSVVNVTIALIRSTPSAQASQALFDSSEFLLSSGELGIRLRRAGLAVLQLRFPCLEGGLGRLQRNPLGSDSIALRGQFREALFEAQALRADGLLPSLPVRLGTRHALFRRGFTVFDLVDTMRQALLSFPERRLLRLELAFARFDCGFPALDLLFGLGLATHDGVGPLFELLGLLCVRSLGLRQRRLPRLDVLQIREERGLLLLQRGLQRLDRLRFLRDGSLRRGDLALALFDFGLLGGVFLFERGPSGSQVPFDDLGRVGPFLGSLFDGRGGLLAFLDRGLPAFRRRLPLVQVTFGRLDCPEPQLRGPLGPKQLDGLRLQLRAIHGELLVHPFEPTLQLVERLPAGREISLSPPDVDLSLPRFAFLVRDLPILGRQVLRELLHAFRRPLEFLPPVIEALILRFEGFGLLANLRGLLGELCLPRFELNHPSRERFFAFLDGLLSLRDGGHMLAELRLAVPDGRLLGGEEALASFGLLEPVLEHLPGLGDLLGLGLQIRVQVVHLLPLPFEGRGPRIERRLAIAVGGFLRREFPLQTAEFRLPFRDAASLGLELRFGLLGLHREDLLPGLDLDVLGGPAFLESVEDQAARLLDSLEFGPEGVELPLSHPAPLVLLLEFPFSAVEFLLALDERPLLVPTGIEFLLVRLALAGLLGDRLFEHCVRVSDALDRGLGVASLEVVDADRGMAVVIGADLELGPGARRVLQNLGEGVVAGHVDIRPVLGEDPIASSQDEDPLRRRVAAKDRGLQDPVELHRPKLGEDGPYRFGPPVGDPFHSTGRDFHRVLKIIVTLRRFPRNSDP